MFGRRATGRANIGVAGAKAVNASRRVKRIPWNEVYQVLTEPRTREQDLPRKLGLIDLMALAVGNMIGAAIFLTPAAVARALPSPVWILVAWAFAGVVSLAGALTCAEFGTRMPSSG